MLNDKRATYKSHVFDGNAWIEARRRQAKEEFSRGTLVRHFAGDFGNGLSSYFPIWLRDDSLASDRDSNRRANLSAAAVRYLDRVGASAEDLFHHVLATVHSPVYRSENAGALRMEWPRIPVPGWSDGTVEGAAEELTHSAKRGRRLAALLDPHTPVAGITEGTLRRDISSIAVPATKDGRNMTDDDFGVTAGWGHFGAGDAVMPGQGRAETRAYSSDERSALGDARGVLGENTVDVYLNGRAFWRNVPAAVWEYKLGGYQVLKKWLSYRERSVLGRSVSPEEVQHFMNTSRRISAILLEVSTSNSQMGR